uniref:Alpha-(1,6)-fucosyltransferase N- and catalytic domain-containing protein n=1 Tax=Pyramimonas obovata TaxID=1411642 RepID=A0A7S0RP45_9CHLO
MFRFIWRPNTMLQRKVEEAKASVSWERPIISMHVRHGDACYDHRAQRKCHEFEDYLVAARKIKERYGVRNVFLATDNVAVIAKARANEEFNFLVRETESAKFYSGKGAKEFVERRLAKGEGDPGMIGWDAAIDIEMMGHGDFFVGTMSSSLGRLGFMRMVGMKRYVPPFISLDYAWCPGHLRRGLRVYHVSGEYKRFDC